MSRTKPPVIHGALLPSVTADTALVARLTEIAKESLRDTDAVVALLDQLRRTAPRDYLSFMVAVAKLGVEVPQPAPHYNVISAIPRTKLDELPPMN